MIVSYNTERVERERERGQTPLTRARERTGADARVDVSVSMTILLKIWVYYRLVGVIFGCQSAAEFRGGSGEMLAARRKRGANIRKFLKYASIFLRGAK